MLFYWRSAVKLTLADTQLLLQKVCDVRIMMMMTTMLMMALVVSVRPGLSEDQLSQNIVTEEVRTEVVKTKYGRVQGFLSRVGRAASSARYVQIYLGIPYASPPTANYRYL